MDEKENEERATFKLQILSDVHLEFGDTLSRMKPVKQTGAEVIALLGDIGWVLHESYVTFLSEMSAHYTAVLLIAGNHEHYTGEYHRVQKYLRDLCESRFDNVFFLDNDFVDLDHSVAAHLFPNVRFLGSTLWSSFPKHLTQYAKESVHLFVNDFDKISLDSGTIDTSQPLLAQTIESGKQTELLGNEETMSKLRMSDMNSLNEAAVRFIRSEIDSAKRNGRKLIVLTHHSPLTIAVSMGNDHRDSEIAKCSAYSPLESLVCETPLLGWFFGHTHRNLDLTVMDGRRRIRVATNQSGYLFRSKSAFYSSSKTIDLDPECEDSGQLIPFDADLFAASMKRDFSKEESECPRFKITAQTLKALSQSKASLFKVKHKDLGCLGCVDRDDCVCYCDSRFCCAGLCSSDRQCSIL